MAKKSGKGAGDGSNVPEESALLEGELIVAAKSTFAGADYSRGYPEPEMTGWERMKMDNLGGRKK